MFCLSVSLFFFGLFYLRLYLKKRYKLTYVSVASSHSFSDLSLFLSFFLFHFIATIHTYTGGPLGEGDKKNGRWHAPGSNKGWTLVKTDNLHGLYEHASEWGDLIEWTITPVLPDGEGKLLLLLLLLLLLFPLSL